MRRTRSHPTSLCDCPIGTDCAFGVGSLEVGAVGAGAFDVVNLGDAPVSIVSVEVLGDPSFSLHQAPTELDPAESGPVVFAVQPQAPTTITASLFVTWSDPQATIEVALQAQGAAGSLTIDPLSCDFGDVPVGTSSQPCVVALSNPGIVDLAIDDIAFAPPFSAPLPAARLLHGALKLADGTVLVVGGNS